MLSLNGSRISVYCKPSPLDAGSCSLVVKGKDPECKFRRELDQDEREENQVVVARNNERYVGKQAQRINVPT